MEAGIASLVGSIKYRDQEIWPASKAGGTTMKTTKHAYSDGALAVAGAATIFTACAASLACDTLDFDDDNNQTT